MTIVLDTNIWISALLWGGTPYEVLELSQQQRWVLICTPKILAELQRTISRPKFTHLLIRGGWTIQELVDAVSSISTHVSDQPSSLRIPADPTDEKFVAAAVAGEADVIVSGDRHLLDLKEVAGIPILTPAQFVRRYRH